MFPWSVTAKAGMPISFAAATSSPTGLTAWSTLNCECTCKCVNGTSSKAEASPPAVLVGPASWAATFSEASKLATSSLGASYSTFSGSSNSGRTMTLRRTISKKQRAVADTSYAASWASPNPSPKSFKCSSVSVGHLNLPPRPPGMAQYSVPSSLESMRAFSVNGSGACPKRTSSAPATLTSNPMLWPMTYVACAASAMNSFMTWPSGKPSSCARAVVIP